MKKKTNRQKRTLIGAVCVAAVIMAGSTFAWFTSSDEVTNRLSASADYGVSIVESFTPPNNWIPGQEVKKDVYATNTGNIGAFVKEEISGALTITTEKATTSKTANSIKLSEEERYVMEAGAYLAYKPDSDTTNKLGDQIVIRPDDAEVSVPTKTDFTPGGAGLYVFRRQITVAGDAKETFEYSGYYYDNGNYYKISNLQVTPDSTVDKAGDTVHADGNLSSASAGFYEEETKVINPVDLAYATNPMDGTNALTGNYLVASYSTGNVASNNASQLQALADAYDKALHDLEYAKALQNAANSEATAAQGDASSGLTQAETELTAKEAALVTAQNDLNTAKTNLSTAQQALARAQADQTAAQAAVNQSLVNLYGGTVDSPNDESTATADSLKGKLDIATATATSAATAYTGSYTGASDAFKTEVGNWITANGITHTFDNLTVEEWKQFKTYAESQTSDAAHAYYAAAAAKAIAQKEYDDELTKLYGSTTIPASIDAATDGLAKVLTDANTALGSNSDTVAGTAYGDVAVAQTALGSETDVSTANTAYGRLKKAQEEYTTAKGAYDAAKELSDGANLTKDEADALVTAAEANLAAAKAAYDAAANASTGVLSEDDGVLKIYIKLSDNVTTATPTTNSQWQMLPTSVGSDNKATFYYTGILDAGETSSRLIESVQLGSDATQDMYKYFDFDLNVALKSAQITYADDQETILADATPTELGAVATLTTPKDIDTVLTWN